MKILLILILMIYCLSYFYFGNWSKDSFKFEEVRVDKMELCLIDRQFPCRWVGNYGNELGTPLFNYLAPLPYYIGGLMLYLVHDYSFAVKMLFVIPVLLINVCLLIIVRGKDFQTKKSILILFVLAAVYWYLVNVHGISLGVLWAVVSLAFAIFSFIGLVHKNTVNNGLIMTIFVSFFLLSHQGSALIFSGLAFVGLIYVWLKRQIKLSWLYVGSLVLAMGVSAFYVFPMIIESDLVRQNAINGDYLPVSVRSVPDKEPVSEISLLVGNASIFGYERGSASFRFGIDNNDHAIVRLAIPYYPNWVIKSNGVEIKNYYDNNSLGLMTLIFGEGRFIVEGKLHDTPVREISNIISGVSMVIVLTLLFSEMGRIRQGLKYYLNALHT